MILLKWIIKRGCETAVRIHLAQPGCSYLPLCASGNERSGCTEDREFLLVPNKIWNYRKSPSYRRNFATFFRAAPRRRSALRNFHLASTVTAPESRASWTQPLEGVCRLFGIRGGNTGSTSGCRHTVSWAREHRTRTVGPNWAPQTDANWCSRWRGVGNSARLYYRLSWRGIVWTFAITPRRWTEIHRRTDRQTERYIDRWIRGRMDGGVTLWLPWQPLLLRCVLWEVCVFGEETFLMFERVSVHCEVQAGADRKTEHRAYNNHRTLRLVKLTRRLCRIKKQAMFGPWSSAWIIWRTLVFLPVPT